jgi:NADH:ubiquinone oxidoreductase subunit 6 (subunit J)
MLTLLLIVVAVVFAFEAIRARMLLTSALWLAGTSALLSVVFYLLGARQVAVIELSVGAGLVTVLLVFAINIAGDEPIEQRQVLPKLLPAGLVLAFALLLGWFLLPLPGPQTQVVAAQTTLADVLWNQRGLDVLVQVVLIFSGVLGFLGLLAEVKPPLEGSAAEEVMTRRQNEMQALEVEVSHQEGLQK